MIPYIEYGYSALRVYIVTEYLDAVTRMAVEGARGVDGLGEEEDGAAVAARQRVLRVWWKQECVVLQVFSRCMYTFIDREGREKKTDHKLNNTVIPNLLYYLNKNYIPSCYFYKY